MEGRKPVPLEVDQILEARVREAEGAAIEAKRLANAEDAEDAEDLPFIEPGALIEVDEREVFRFTTEFAGTGRVVVVGGFDPTSADDASFVREAFGTTVEK